MASRSYFVNPLTWEEDEERAALLPILFERTGATGFYDATAVKEGADWILCWYGRTVPDGEFWFQQCIKVPNTTEGTVTLPCCPSREWSKFWRALFVPWPEYPGCEALMREKVDMHWFGDVEPYGRWVGVQVEGEDGVLTVELTPAGCSETGQWFEAIFTWNGNEFFRVSWHMPCNVGISRGFVDQNEKGPCPDVFTMFEIDTDPG